MRSKITLLACLITIALGTCSNIYAQNNSICGIVTDAKTGKTLAGVNIFLNKTTIGTFSDENGRYMISELPSGNYTLVFSFIGYKQVTKQLSIHKSFEDEINITLEPKKYALNELDVKGDDPKEWRRNLKRFKKWFLGSSRNADKTTIQNPVILNFKNENGQFIATAEEPLIIINCALGYKIYFFSRLFHHPEQWLCRKWIYPFYST